MKTKSLIKRESALLFNELGVVNVTLRDVAKQLNKSYGNVTYHFANKEDLLSALFEDMHLELSNLQEAPETEWELMRYLLQLPEINYDITLKYLFFTKDIVEIQRHFPALFANCAQLNLSRKEKWIFLLKKLRDSNFLKDELSDEDLNYITILSASIRSFYFQSQESKNYTKESYLAVVNQLLKPYLGSKGIAVFSEL